MAYSIKINGVSKIPSDGMQITEISGEELNSAVLKLSHFEKLNLQEKDKIEIIDSMGIGDTEYENFHYYFYLGNYIEERILNNEDPLEVKYNYTLSLLSPTIALEDYILPNRTITQKISEGDILGKNSIYYYMKAYIDEYAPTLTISNALKTRTENIEALEDQFPNLNLREIFNKLLEPLGCVVSMKNYTEISYMDLNVKGQEIALTNLKKYNEQATFEDYVTHLKIIAENCTSENINISEKNVAVKSSGDNLVTDDNMSILTEHSIYEIAKVYCYAKVNATLSIDGGTTQHQYLDKLMKLDITPFISEKNIYDSKYVNGANFRKWLDGNGEFDLNECLKYKITSFSFTEGMQNIEGLSYNEKKIFDDFYSYDIVLKAALIYYDFKKYKKLSPLVTINYTNYIWSLLTEPRDLIFDIEYNSRQTLNLEFEKEKAYKNKRVMIDGQTSSYIDNNKLGFSMQEKVNRLGNTKLSIGGTFKNSLLIPNLDDTIGDYKLVQRTLTFFKNEILFEGELYKYFNRKILNTSVNQKIRYTTIDTTNNAVIRMENTRLIFTLSNDENNEIADANTFSLINYMISNLGKSGDELAYAYITTDSQNIQYGVFKVFPSFQKINNSLVLSFKMKDNYTAGVQIKDTSQTGGYGLANIPYCDINGEFLKAKFTIYKNYSIDPLTNQEKAQEEARSFPIFPATTIATLTKVYEKENLRYKDNREIMGETFQFDFRSKENIFIKKAFIESLSFLLTEKKFDDFKVFISETETYTENSTAPKGENKFSGGDCTVNNGALIMPASYFTNASSWAITDDKNNLLLACNGNSNILRFNFK